MSKDKKNKSVKNELKSVLNSNTSFDDDTDDLPFAFNKDESNDNSKDEAVSFTNISVSSSEIQEEDDDSDKHIQVTFGEAVESTAPTKAEPKETSKETLVAKKMLKKNNGTAVSRMIKDKPTKKERQTVWLGVIISILVCIGFVTTVSTVTNFTKNIVNATSLKGDLTNVVFPMVIIDIPEFETPTNLDSSVIISTAIWSFITDTSKDMGKYQQDDLGSTYVPDVDIEIYVRKLYGSAIDIKHQTVNDSNIQMVYNEQEKMYIIESNPSFLPYSPRIDDIKRTGSIYTLTVSYILPTVSWSLSSYDVYAQEADKIMEYKLQKIDDNYQFLSVKLIAINDHNISSSHDEMEYIGNQNNSGFDDSEVIPDMLLDEQIANDIMAEEAKKAESENGEGDTDGEETDDEESEGVDEDGDDTSEEESTSEEDEDEAEEESEEDEE